VRFGNVLGSSGSVVPLFKDQIRRGGPVRVTDPQVSRYFMTIPESVLLILHASALALSKPVHRRNGVYVLEMGDPVRILDLAKRMIAFYAPDNQKNIPITYSGLREGEKLSEQLVDEGEAAYASATQGILEVRSDESPRELTPAEVAHLELLARESGDDAVRLALFKALDEVRGVERPLTAEAAPADPEPVLEATGSDKVISLPDRKRRAT